jgi:hypothetical protein
MAFEDWPNWKKTAVISGAISGSIPLLVPVLSWGIEAAGYTSVWLTWVSAGILGAATYEVPIWINVLVLGITGTGLYMWWLFTEEDGEMTREDYTSDHIEGVEWMWEWEEDEVYSLNPICPECSMDLSLDEVTEVIDTPSLPSQLQSMSKPVTVGAETECDGCLFNYKWDKGPKEVRSYVEKEIKRRVRTGEYKA